MLPAQGWPGHHYQQKNRRRFDPIIPTVYRLDRFRRLAGQAAALGIRRCVLNFVAAPGRYKRLDARLGAALAGWDGGMPGYDEAWRLETAARLVEAAGEFGLSMAACAESAGLAGQAPGLQAAACGDHGWFVALSGSDPGRAQTTGSRRGCGCAATSVSAAMLDSSRAMVAPVPVPVSYSGSTVAATFPWPVTTVVASHKTVVGVRFDRRVCS